MVLSPMLKVISYLLIHMCAPYQNVMYAVSTEFLCMFKTKVSGTKLHIFSFYFLYMVRLLLCLLTFFRSFSFISLCSHLHISLCFHLHLFFFINMIYYDLSYIMQSRKTILSILFLILSFIISD